MNESPQKNAPQTKKAISLELQRESLQLVSSAELSEVVGGGHIEIGGSLQRAEPGGGGTPRT